MATTKDFTIKQYNGTDYDVLEPSSVSSQIHLSEAIVAKLNALEVTTTDDLDKLLDSLTVRVSSAQPTNPVKGTWWYQIVTGGSPGGSPTYVVGLPVALTLTGWDPAVQGTTYKLKAEGYKIGAGGVQLGLPSDSSTVNTQAVIAAALTIVNTKVTAPDKEKNVAGFTEITISAVTAPSRDLTVAIFGLEEVEPVTITKSAIDGIAVPVAGNTPASTIEGEQFTGTVSWYPDKVDGKFGPLTVYTATITLMPKLGYKLDGVATNFFTVEGASSVSNSANSGVVTAVFPETGTVTVWERNISGIPIPKTGKTPVSTINEDTNFTGTVSWSPAASTFAASTVYTATITLTAKAGFTFEGVEENSFSVTGLPSSVTNAANSNVVTAVFPAT